MAYKTTPAEKIEIEEIKKLLKSLRGNCPPKSRGGEWAHWMIVYRKAPTIADAQYALAMACAISDMHSARAEYRHSKKYLSKKTATSRNE